MISRFPELFDLTTSKMTRFSLHFKRHLRTRIEACSLTEQSEIFKIVKDSCAYTQNRNGVFLNLTNIEDSILDKIIEYVSFSQQNKNDFEEHDKKVQICKLNSSVPMDETTLKKNLNEGSKDDWDKLIIESKGFERVNTFVSMLNMSRNLATTHATSAENIVKKSSSLFSNACKKFARRAISTKKNEHEFANELSMEPFTYAQNSRARSPISNL